MTDADASSFGRHARRIAGLPAADRTDAELLGSVVARQDEAAFEVLVWRHGPKVLGICRRVLRHEQDAEDAFQATFLMLVRAAGSIGRGEAVGSWLYRVAYRVALRARTLARRRAGHPAGVPDVPAAEPTPGALWADLRPVLDEEVNRLPAKYRAPFVLCYIDGKTNEEAARELGCPKGTVLSRLAWARERLRVRLTRRGITLTVGLPAAVLMTDAAASVVPAALADSTTRAALLVAAGVALPDAASGSVAALTKGASRAMYWTQGVILAACVLTAGGLGVGVAERRAGGAAPPAVAGAQAPEPAQSPAKAEPPKAEKMIDLVFREVPWAKVLEWYSEQSGLPFVGTVKPTGTVTILPPPVNGKKPRYTLGEVTDLLNDALTQQKFILVRRDKSFTVLPADEKIDSTQVPRVSPDELKKRGRTELVTVAIPLTHFRASDIGPEVEKVLSRFGEVVVLERFKQLVVRDMAGNVSRIHEMIKSAEAEAGMGKK